MSRGTHAAIWLVSVCIAIAAIGISISTTGTVSLVLFGVTIAAAVVVIGSSIIYWLGTGRNPYRGFPFMLFDRSDNQDD